MDFGFAEVAIGEASKGAFYAMALPYSGDVHVWISRECNGRSSRARVTPSRTFGVPRRIACDNTKIAVIAVGRGRSGR